MCEGIETEVFLVMTDRRDGTFPKIAKTCQPYRIEEDAQRYATKLNKEIGPYYGVYRALIKVTNKVDLHETDT